MLDVFVLFVLGGLLYQVIEVFTKSAVHLWHHPQALLLGGVRVLDVFVLFVLGGLLYQVIEVFTKSAVHLLLHTHFY